MNTFQVYLSSKGSSSYFPTNKANKFINVLETPLSGMTDYKVCMSACFLSSPLTKGVFCHVLCDIVQPSPYDDRKMPLLGIVTSENVSLPEPIYAPVCQNTISAISVSLTDSKGDLLQLTGNVLLTLSFQRQT